jgi:hypothetical protein
MEFSRRSASIKKTNDTQKLKEPPLIFRRLSADNSTKELQRVRRPYEQVTHHQPTQRRSRLGRRQRSDAGQSAETESA